MAPKKKSEIANPFRNVLGSPDGRKDTSALFSAAAMANVPPTVPITPVSGKALEHKNEENVENLSYSSSNTAGATPMTATAIKLQKLPSNAESIANRARSERRRQSAAEGPGEKPLGSSKFGAETRRLRLEVHRLTRANTGAQKDLQEMSKALLDKEAELRATTQELRLLHAQQCGADGTNPICSGTKLSAPTSSSSNTASPAVRDKARRATVLARSPHRKSRYSLGSGTGRSRYSEGFGNASTGGTNSRFSLMGRQSLDVDGRHSPFTNAAVSPMAPSSAVATKVSKLHSEVAGRAVDIASGTSRGIGEHYRQNFIEFSHLTADLTVFERVDSSSTMEPHAPARDAVPAVIQDRWAPQNPEPVVSQLPDFVFPNGVNVRLSTSFEARKVVGRGGTARQKQYVLQFQNSITIGSELCVWSRNA